MVTGCSVRDGWKRGRGRGRRAVSRPAPRPTTHCGQLASMLSSVVLASCPPLIHAVMSRQNRPDPTSPGIWSEPSKTNSVDS